MYAHLTDTPTFVLQKKTLTPETDHSFLEVCFYFFQLEVLTQLS